MFSKDNYEIALKKLGFEQIEMTRSDGSHKNFQHTKFKNLRICIVDHKNTKELSAVVHNELLSTLTLVVVLETLNAGVVDFNKAKDLLKGIDKEMARIILQKIKKLNMLSDNCLLNLLPRKYLNEMRKYIDDVTNEAVLDILNNKM